MAKRSKFFRIFDIKQLPYDFARLNFIPPALLYTRPKILDITGKRMKGVIRGGQIIAPNHTSFFDPFAIECATWYRRKYSLAAEVLMDKPGGLGLRLLNCIRVDRNAIDLEAIRRSVEVLNEGRLLVVFPQGGIDRSCEIGELKQGIILMAIKAGAPIQPVYTEKKAHWYSRQVFVFGEPLVCNEICTKKVPSMGDMTMLLDMLRDRLNKCKEVYKEHIGKKRNQK